MNSIEYDSLSIKAALLECIEEMRECNSSHVRHAVEEHVFGRAARAAEAIDRVIVQWQEAERLICRIDDDTTRLHQILETAVREGRRVKMAELSPEGPATL